MKGAQSHDVDVALPASEVWEVYGTIRLAELAAELVPQSVAKFEIIQGDGGVGTILKVFFPPGSPGPAFHMEKFVLVDDKKRVKDVDVIEGGYLELGFSAYKVRFEILEKEGGVGSVIRNVVEYEISDELAANASYITVAPFVALAEAVAKYLAEKKATA
uniref:1-phenethylisoquinoline scaffold synthase n=1 Tax=Gloriosa superba TaxID=41220 RepID=A0AAU6SI64_GLOSU